MGLQEDLERFLQLCWLVCFEERNLRGGFGGGEMRKEDIKKDLSWQLVRR